MKIKYIFIVVVTFFTISCENPDTFLDVLPTGRVIPSTLEDFESLLNSYTPLRDRNQVLKMTDPDIVMNATTFELLYNNEYKEAYKWNSNMYTVDQNDPEYIDVYNYIYVYNFILSLVDDAEPGKINPAERTNIKAEAYAQRAFEYFCAVNQYAHHYDPANPDAQGIAMPLEPNLELSIGYSTVGEVYAQIISDSETALSLFSDSYPDLRTDGNYRPGKASIYALLAEVYLYMGDFDKALTNSNKALAMHNFLYDYNTIDFANPDDLWAGYTNEDIQRITLNKEVFWARYIDYGGYVPYYTLYSPEVVALFDQNNDRRWYLHATQEARNGAFNVSPDYLFVYSRGERPNGLGVSRLILTNAEAKVRTGDGAGAIAALNTLLEKRISNFTPIAFTDNAAALQLVKNERRKELFGSGLNVFDQKRYHVYGETVPTYTRVAPDTGDPLTLAPGADGYVVNVPLGVKSLNPNLN
ncbi:RagB/SusD family nutrient uptake outer membrane protein [Tamlana sp. I1]|uniref:RagB/SusD family nutrient uptake outer membrane protein n=1 Tax=Tamlana sp. I1 TaxID=2762061 RepID=UPI00188EA451|nr:RagB/SusD family nutrient uptake outer membrane protein [Tamlana sp. I1]